MIMGKMMFLMPDFHFAAQLEQLLSGICTVVGASMACSIENVRASDPDMIVVDVDYYGNDSLRLCAQLKEDWTTSHIFIVGLYRKKVDSELYLNTGVDFCIQNPVSCMLLSVQLRNIVQTHRQFQLRLNSKLSIKEPLLSKTGSDIFTLDSLNEIISKHVDNAKLDVEFICHELGLAHWQLYRRVKELSGCTIREYIRIYRIKMSAYMVLEQKYTMCEVAYMVGFTNPSYFTHCFKQVFGCTPSEFATQQSALINNGFVPKISMAPKPTINKMGIIPSKMRTYRAG
jgi:AraC-like DNA-binding protein